MAKLTKAQQEQAALELIAAVLDQDYTKAKELDAQLGGKLASEGFFEKKGV